MLEILNEGPEKGKRFELIAPLSHVGRGDHNDVAIRDESVSESHAKIQRREDAWYIVDMDSTNGTYVAGSRVYGEAKVSSGGDVRFGGVKMLFRTMGGGQRATGETRVIGGAWAGPQARSSGSRNLRVAWKRTMLRPRRKGRLSGCGWHSWRSAPSFSPRPPGSLVELTVAARSDVGMIRSGNEDAFFAHATQERGVFIVADGMGRARRGRSGQ
ncbi:MAG: FHA domain-containing protein [Gemmatimonadetes bacterium]|nr:FHA domain-containing protein [Gemmatimonadota bacterium]